MLAAFWSGIPVEDIHNAGVVPRRRRAAIGIPFQSPHTTRRETVGAFCIQCTIQITCFSLHAWIFRQIIEYLHEIIDTKNQTYESTNILNIVM